MALSKITTNSIADDAVTTAKMNPAQTDITSVGTLTSFASTGIDDNAEANAVTIDSSQRVGISNTSPLVKLDVTGSNTAPASSGTSQSGSLRLGQTAGNGVVDMGFDTVNTQGWIQATNKANLATNYKLTLNPNGGVVTAPTQPLTVVRYAANTEHGSYNAGSNRNIIICKPSNVEINQGSHFNTSTGQFTCPVDGTYRVSFMGNYLNNDVSNYVLIQIRKNGSSVDQYYQDDLGTWNHVIRVAYITCSANDTLEVYNNSDSAGASKGGFDIVQYTAFNYSLVI